MVVVGWNASASSIGNRIRSGATVDRAVPVVSSWHSVSWASYSTVPRFAQMSDPRQPIKIQFRSWYWSLWWWHKIVATAFQSSNCFVDKGVAGGYMDVGIWDPVVTWLSNDVSLSLFLFVSDSLSLSLSRCLFFLFSSPPSFIHTGSSKGKVTVERCVWYDIITISFDVIVLLQY